jgi:hypothetical protein
MISQAIIFKTDGFEYQIKISPYQGTTKSYFSVGFGVLSDEMLGYDTSLIVNENPYRIITTICETMLLFMKSNFVEGFIFSFTGDKDKNKQRLLLYKRGLKKYFPESEIELREGIYYIHLNN